jgi:hypothetical protein
MAFLRREGLMCVDDGGDGDRMRMEELRDLYSLV